MTTFRRYCQHILNPLHVFCRLRQVGLPGTSARRVCSLYERGLYRYFL